MGKIPSDHHEVTTDVAVRVPPHPVYIAPEGCASLSQVLVDFEAFLLDESGEKARYAHLQEMADERFDKEVEAQKRLQAEAALAEEKRLHEESALEAAMRRVQDTMEIARSDCFSSEEESEEGSEPDSESFVSSPSPSESSSSLDSASEAVSFRPRQTKTSNLKCPRKPRQRYKPYPKRAPTRTPTPPPKSPPEEFYEFFTQNKAGDKTALGRNQYWVHSIDWVNAPPTWDGKPIPAMAADDVTAWLRKTSDIFKGKVCKMGACLHDEKKQIPRSNLKAHLVSSEHLNLRRMCHICRFATRDDVFKDRHNCEGQQAKNAAVIRRSPGPLVPSYTWKPSDW